ncbi:DUF2273 domain-containing protein [Chengkuizengella axinellae]|uniref:DUF2273 domain-containing protein n=1 Tax=Chengkuizengella axinellae TaxID=3064388 RepID=A0ABT9IW93_9BACL|nr:DUF2273 domain-containing protein [Chengkuizengella sp. 2205SS18-9]MDP5273603.1 DUF2273 domain-containing protein [Chengkuizengella sp. 2205SS18-9]
MWNDLWDRHPGKLIGSMIGFLFGIIYLIVGFWHTFMFALIVFIGFYIGRKMDSKEEWKMIASIKFRLSRLLDRYR